MSAALLPLATPSAFRADAVGTLPSLAKPRAISAPVAPPEPQIARDPFVPDALETVQTAPDGDLTVLPPNDGAGAEESGGTATLEAVIFGKATRALIRIGDRPQVVEVGQRLLNSEILRIDALGVHLASGEVLRLRRTP